MHDDRGTMKIRDLKTAYNVLCELDYDTPKDLLVHIAQLIRTTESRTTARRKARMTEEQLIHLENKQKRLLRIYLPDGRMIQKTSTEAVFREAVREIGVERMASLAMKMGRKDVIFYDETMARRRIRRYYFLQPGYFLVDGCTAAEKYDILTRADALLRLNWDIELV